MKKIAIIGASYLQAPLIKKASEKGLETHVFAWETHDVGETLADYFYPISIGEKDIILEKCKQIGIDGICSIASDLAVITVNYVAEKMGLIGNPMTSVSVTTNKHRMRRCFEINGDPSPKSYQVENRSDLTGIELKYPIIVKPVDRSGSRGISKIYDAEELDLAIENAKRQGFEKVALIEEFAEGQEYSIEYISWKGKHTFLSMTKKYTTGSPKYIETGHIEPADVDGITLDIVKSVISHALDSLGVQYGASHSEIKIDAYGEIKIIEIGARMGGDLIGSSLVELSTGFDFVSAVIDIALGKEPQINLVMKNCAAIRFICDEQDLHVWEQLKEENPEIIVGEDIREVTKNQITDSESRFGYFLISGDRDVLAKYMPHELV